MSRSHADSSRLSLGLAVVVMGVSGAGKTTVARALAEALGLPYLEGDAHHPPGNRAKLSAGIPLQDEDRWPWLRALAAAAAEARAEEGGVVSTCSALKRAYRDVLREHLPGLRLVYLQVDPAIASARVATRPEHFASAAIVPSQFAALEPPTADEAAITADCRLPLPRLVRSILDGLGRSAI